MSSKGRSACSRVAADNRAGDFPGEDPSKGLSQSHTSPYLAYQKKKQLMPVGRHGMKQLTAQQSPKKRLEIRAAARIPFLLI